MRHLRDEMKNIRVLLQDIYCRINYTEQVDKRDIILASEERVKLQIFQLHSIGFSGQRVYKL